MKGIIAGTPPHDHLCDKMDEIGHENPVRVVLDRTPFYGESGGQVGDAGKLVGDGFEFKVTDTQKDGQLIVHVGHLVRGTLREGAKVKAIVDVDRRAGIRRAHSATHILHYALQKNLGTHAQQQGSKVDDDWLRFDFTNLSPVTAEQLATISRDVTSRVEAGEPVKWEILPLADARKQGAMMLFGEKYPDPVRMVSMGRRPQSVQPRALRRHASRQHEGSRLLRNPQPKKASRPARGGSRRSPAAAPPNTFRRRLPPSMRRRNNLA